MEQPPSPEPSPEPTPAKPPAMRASDADRERVARILHEAMAEGRLDTGELDERLRTLYAAKTLDELTPLTADLPAAHQQAAQATQVARPAPANPPSHRLTDQAPTSTTAIAVMSGANRKGVWVVPDRFQAFALMGGVEMDLTEARFTSRETVINVVAIMGGVEIRVPDDIVVRVEGIGFMGAFDSRVGGEAPPGAPVVRITGLAFMGGVEVKPAKRRRRPEIEH